MFEFINKIRNFKFSDLTPLQIAVGIVAVVIVLAVLNFLLGIANQLLPIVLLAVAAYFGYQWLTSRQDKKEDAALSELRAKREANDSVQQEDGAAVESSAGRSMQVDQIINPETGFAEPDITRLIEREQQKLAEADRVNDDVMAQIEARRRRLLGNQNDD